MIDELVRSNRKPARAVGANFVIIPEVTELTASMEVREVVSANGTDLVSVKGALALNVRVLSPTSGVVAAQYPVRVTYAPPGVMKAAAVARANAGGGVGNVVGRPVVNGPVTDPAVYVELARLAGQIVVERALEQTNALQVVAREGDRIWVNRGADGGWLVGQTLRIVLRGKELIDPISGEVLGTTTTEIGTARIVETQPKLSIAEIQNASSDVAVGALIQRSSIPTSR